MENINHRAKIETSLGTFEFEGSKEFVESQIKSITELINSSSMPIPTTPKQIPKSEQTKRKQTVGNGRTKVETPKLLSELIDDVKLLKTFVSDKNPTSHPEIYTTIAVWMKKSLGLDNFSIDEMFTAYKLLNRKEPKAMTQVFRDAKSKGVWFDQAEEKGRFTLTRYGESMVDHDLPHTKAKN